MLALFVALVLTVLWVPRASAEPRSGGFDATAAQTYVSDYTSRHGLPGAAYVVVQDGEPVATGAAGDVSASTPLALGSVSKSFTAFAALQLVDEGSVGLDDPITTYLPDFSLQGTDSGAITVRMLLSHTSGVPNPTLVTPTGSLAGDVAEISGLTAASPPGEDYLYSNFNYRTLARLVEVVTGQDFDAYLSEHVFAPLGMEDTTSVITAGDLPGLRDGHVTAYGLAIPAPPLRTTIGGSGGVISTAEDLGAWLGMQQRGGVAADGERLLPAELVELSHTPQRNAGSYGLGWQHTSTADPARVGHDGSLLTYSAREDLVPSNDTAVAVLLDSYTPTFSHPFELSTGLIEISEGRTPEVGAPVATIIDLVALVLTVFVAASGVLGVRHSARWAARRADLPRWWRLLRLAPHLFAPVAVGILFLGLTMGPGNPATPVTTFTLWPAAMVLLLTGAVVGLALIIARLQTGRRLRAGRRLPSAPSSKLPTPGRPTNS